MDAKCLEIIALTWDLTKKQNALLNTVIPIAHDLARCLIDGRQPTPEQVSSWDAIKAQVSQSMRRVAQDS
jgi:hypothetical protein